MKFEKRLKTLLFILTGAAFVLTLLAVFVQDQGSAQSLSSMRERLGKADQERLEALMAEKGSDGLQLLADQVKARREDLEDASIRLASESAVIAHYAKGKGGPARAAALQQALDRLAGAQKGRFVAISLTDKKGAVLAHWGLPAEKAKSLDGDVLFKSVMATEEPGLALHDYLRREAAPAAQPSKGPATGGSAAGSGQAKPQSFLAVACGIAGPDEKIAGVLRAVAPMQPSKDILLGLPVQNVLTGIREASPHALVFLLRGSGEQVFHSSKGPYAESFKSLGPDYDAAAKAMASSTYGRLGIKSYDSKAGLLVWKRVGSWNKNDGPGALLTLVAFMPEEDFRGAGNIPAEPASAFYKRPLVLLLILLSLIVPMALGLLLMSRESAPLRRTLEVASSIDEFGNSPAGLEFREEMDPEISAVNRGLNALLQKARTAEARVAELDAALKRVEDQASKDATTASQELSELRTRLGGSEAEKAAANSKFDAAIKAKGDAEAQLGNLKTALETASRSMDLKNSENKNLSAQVQDLMRMLEETRKVAQQAQETVGRREDEVVRLSAVNTLSSELKATLSVIKNYISTMLGSVGAISDAQQEFLGVVINKSARLERLIADLVELSEISSGIKPPKMEPSSVPAIFQEALINTRPQADHKKIQLDFAESSPSPQVNLDKEKIGGLLRALLAQAIKVTSRNEKVSILVSGRENAAEIRISDPGMSLPPDRASKVFNQFHGVDSQAGPEFIGTGLRFPIMRAVVEAHGGKIWIESQVGRGKTFVLSLPKSGTFVPGKAQPGPGLAAPSLPVLAPPPAPAAPSAPEVAKFDSIFGDAPKPAAPGGLPSLPGLPPLGPPPKPLGGLPPLGPPPAPAGLGGLPGLGTPPPPPAPPKPSLPKADAASFDAIFGDPSTGSGQAAPKPSGPPPAMGAVPPPPPKIEPKTAAGKGPLAADDKANFDSIFGAPPPQALEAKEGGSKLPKVELKTAAAKSPLPTNDLANFDAIFGGGSPKPSGPPPAPGAVPPPPPPKPALPKADAASFDAIFGDSPKPSGPPPAPGATPPPPPPPKGGFNTMEDLNSMLGGA